MAPRVDAADTRARILEAACDLIAAEGIDEVRIARVATKARASTSLVHHYFSTREELLEEALLHSYDQVALDRFGDEPDASESATAGLRRAILECLPVDGPQERGWVLWVELWLRAARDPELRPLATKLYARYREWMAGVIRAGVESGEFAAEADPEALADEAMALLDGAGVRALMHDPEMEIDRARALVARTLGEQLGVDPSALGG